jgi:hypothetical protein
MTTSKAFNVKGTTEDVTTCDLCGREDLKFTVALAVLDADGNETEIVHYGSDCGAKVSGWTQADVMRRARNADTVARTEGHQRQLAENRSREDDFMVGFREWLRIEHGVFGIEQVSDLWDKVPGMTPYQLRKTYKATL